MADIIVDYSELGNRFHKDSYSHWNMNMDPGYPEAACPAVGDVITLTGYRVDPYTSTETASAQFYYVEEGGTGYLVEANTREGGTTLYAEGVDEAIASGTVSFTVTEVREGDGVWMVALVFGTPPVEEKALGGNAVTFLKEKMEDMVGDLSALQTTNKSSTVAAINEVLAGSAKIVELTTADYNYPVNNPDCIALWLLPAGVYHQTGLPIKTSTTSTSSGGTAPGSYYIIYKANDVADIAGFGRAFEMVSVWHTRVSTGENLGRYRLTFVDNLTSVSVEEGLTAKQGKVLNDRIGDLSTLQTTAKTSTVDAINELVAGGGGAATINSQDWSTLWQ